jgi:hypothetical protein
MVCTLTLNIGAIITVDHPNKRATLGELTTSNHMRVKGSIAADPRIKYVTINQGSTQSREFEKAWKASRFSTHRIIFQETITVHVSST